MSDKKVVVYSSASGGTIVQKKTTEMVNIVQVLRGGKEVTVVWCDAEPKETREFVCKLSPPSLSLFIVSVSFLTRMCFKNNHRCGARAARRACTRSSLSTTSSLRTFATTTHSLCTHASHTHVLITFVVCAV